MKHFVLTALVFLAGPNAFATGGFGCQYDEDKVKFEINGATSRSFGGAIVNAEGALTGEVGGQGDTDVIKIDTTFNRDDIMQYWSTGREFNLNIYKESDSETEHAWTSVIIKTKSKNDNGELKGTISIEQGSNAGRWSMENKKITCFVEM